MRITSLGHAGLFLDTHQGSILCDPWFNPAYFASWFPFPSNEAVDLEALRHPTYLFISHLHHDHFDTDFLAEHVSKETTIILPDYPLDLLERALRAIGFMTFLRTRNYEPIEVDGLRFITTASVAPTDGPLGDCGLVVDDGQTRIYNQNDSRPIDLERLVSFGPYDAHFLQFSGAIWYPMVYQFPDNMKQNLGRKKRANELARALRYAEEIGASFIFPFAGPPCFLDDELFHFNDCDHDPANTFPDQTVFLDYLHEHGHESGRLMIPGSVVSLQDGRCELQHPLPYEEVKAIFTEKRTYLKAYQARKRLLISVIKSSWPRGQIEIVPALRAWFEPLMQHADLISAGINGRVVIDCSVQAIVLDFHQRSVYPYQGEEWEYYFRFDPALIESCILHHHEDWINELFLSNRFEARRVGAYNEYVYSFFKCLTLERLEYAEGYYAEQVPEQLFFESHGFRIQRRCPHVKADLARFGRIEEGVLTCMLHGWQFELKTGRCLTSDRHRIHARPIQTTESRDALQADGEITQEHETTQGVASSLVQARCHDCWYNPRKW